MIKACISNLVNLGLPISNHENSTYAENIALKRISLICRETYNWVHHFHEDVIKWKFFPRYWPFVWGIHRSPVNSLHKGQWRGALMFSLIRVWINSWINNREAGDLWRYRAHYDDIVMTHGGIPWNEERMQITCYILLLFFNHWAQAVYNQFGYTM